MQGALIRSEKSQSKSQLQKQQQEEEEKVEEGRDGDQKPAEAMDPGMHKANRERLNYTNREKEAWWALASSMYVYVHTFLFLVLGFSSGWMAFGNVGIM